MNTVQDCGQINARVQLAQWLAEDIGDIHDPQAIADTAAFVASVAPAVDQPAGLYELCDALARIAQASSSGEQLAILNRALRRVFIEASPTEENYRTQCESLLSGEELARRRESRNPLPTLDAICVLSPDPRALSACDRAAVLAAAALRLHAERAADSTSAPILGVTLAPGAAIDSLVAAHEEARLLVLARGIPYIILWTSAPKPVILARKIFAPSSSGFGRTQQVVARRSFRTS